MLQDEEGIIKYSMCLECKKDIDDIRDLNNRDLKRKQFKPRIAIGDIREEPDIFDILPLYCQKLGNVFITVYPSEETLGVELIGHVMHFGTTVNKI